MLEGLQNAAKISDLRRRLLFTFALLAVYRIGVAIPTPGIDGEALAAFFEQAASTLFGLVNLFSGGALERFSIFALGIMPYISASIIFQLLTVVIPTLERLSKEERTGATQDYTVYTLQHCWFSPPPGSLYQYRTRTDSGTWREPSCF